MAEKPNRRSLSPEHRRHLMEDAGLSDEMIERLGWYSVDAEEASRLLRFRVPSGGIAIPYPYHPDYVRVRLDSPYRYAEQREDGSVRVREARYLSPKGSRTHAYILPEVWEALDDIDQIIGITEGEKKAAKAIQEGLPCIAIPGVWSWRGKSVPHQAGDEVVETDVLEELQEIPWQGRHVFLFWDSDAYHNAHVKQAGRALAAWLRRQGALVRFVILPARRDGGKTGLDDYLREHNLQELLDYAVKALSDDIERDFDIEAIEKLATDPPTYRVRLSWGVVLDGLSVDQLFSFRSFQKACWAQTGRVPSFEERKGERTWLRYLADLSATVLFVEEVPPDATPMGLWWERVREFLLARAVSDPGALLGDEPYRADGRYYVRAPSLLRHLSHRFGHIREGVLWNILRRHGAEPVTYAVRLGNERRNVRAWLIPAAAVEEDDDGPPPAEGGDDDG